VSLVELLAPFRRRWRLVVFGIGGSWALLLLVLLLAPPRYRCEATLALPNLTAPTDPNAKLSVSIGPALQPVEIQERASTEREGLWERAGIPYRVYEGVARSLQDGVALHSALGEVLDPRSIERMRSSLAHRVSPLEVGVQDDEDHDVVSAVVLSGESDSADRSREAVSTLVSLWRSALTTAIARELIAWEARSSERAIRSLARGKEELRETNASLADLTADLERLARESPAPRPDAPREVVDTRGGGHLYLPPRLQLLGAKARQAEGEHAIRTHEQALARHTLRLGFLRRVERRLEGAGTSIVSDVPGVIADELKQVHQEQDGEGPALHRLQTEMRALGAELDALAARTRLIQYPTVGTVSRAKWAAALASLAVVFFVSAAFMIDLWQRSSTTRDTEGTTAQRASP